MYAKYERAAEAENAPAKQATIHVAMRGLPALGIGSIPLKYVISQNGSIPVVIHNCRNQAISRFDHRQMIAIAIARQL
jgi:hypothetical protein